jgi:uncharacterized membrane protein YhhN
MLTLSSSYPLLLLTFAAAAANWLAVFKQVRWLELVAKPAVIVLLLAWLASLTGLQGPLSFFALGLLFSLGGDVFLMLSPGLFIPGLLSFLAAHLFYIIGLLSQGFHFEWQAAAFAAFLLVIVITYYRVLSRALVFNWLIVLKAPLLIYMIVISLMLLSALQTLSHPQWDLLPALLTAAGALLFFISDGILAWNRFIKPVSNGKLLTRVTYHLGQIFLIFGAVLQFS